MASARGSALECRGELKEQAHQKGPALAEQVMCAFNLSGSEALTLAAHCRCGPLTTDAEVLQVRSA